LRLERNRCSDAFLAMGMSTSDAFLAMGMSTGDGAGASSGAPCEVAAAYRISSLVLRCPGRGRRRRRRRLRGGLDVLAEHAAGHCEAANGGGGVRRRHGRHGQDVRGEAETRRETGDWAVAINGLC
jgi:hypothetical protein